MLGVCKKAVAETVAGDPQALRHQQRTQTILSFKTERKEGKTHTAGASPKFQRGASVFGGKDVRRSERRGRRCVVLTAFGFSVRHQRVQISVPTVLCGGKTLSHFGRRNLVSWRSSSATDGLQNGISFPRTQPRESQ